MDKSWKGDASATVRVRTNDTLAERSAARAQAREDRAAERAVTTTQRLEARSAARQAGATAREEARAARRDSQAKAASIDPHSDAAQRARASGRRDIVREQRDTSGYTTIIDHRRMRELAKRGASASALATAFGITVEEVKQALMEAPDWPGIDPAGSACAG